MVNSATFAFFAGLVAAAQAYTVANGANPSGNPIITPATGSSVEAGKNFDITWTATSGGTVTIYLCKGPSSNCVNEAVPLADKVTNSGSFSWAVSKSLEASTVAGQGYGIQLISDQNNTIFQWSGQFGIVNKNPATASVTAASVSVSSSASGYGQSSSSAVPTSVNSTSASASASSTSSSIIGTITGGATGGANSTTLQPTKPMTIPSSLKTSTADATGSSRTSTSTTAVSTGAAAAIKVGAGALVGGVLAALAL